MSVVTEQRTITYNVAAVRKALALLDGLEPGRDFVEGGKAPEAVGFAWGVLLSFLPLDESPRPAAERMA